MADGFFSLLFGQKEPEENFGSGYPLADAKRDWAKALKLVQAGRYDMVAPLYRRTIEDLLAHYLGSWNKTVASSDLLIPIREAFGEPPAEIVEAISFINPHFTRVKNVYSYSFICEMKEKTCLVIKWFAKQRPKYSTIDTDIDPARKTDK